MSELFTLFTSRLSTWTCWPRRSKRSLTPALIQFHGKKRSTQNFCWIFFDIFWDIMSCHNLMEMIQNRVKLIRKRTSDIGAWKPLKIRWTKKVLFWIQFFFIDLIESRNLETVGTSVWRIKLPSTIVPYERLGKLEFCFLPWILWKWKSPGEVTGRCVKMFPFMGNFGSTEPWLWEEGYMGVSSNGGTPIPQPPGPALTGNRGWKKWGRKKKKHPQNDHV